MNAGKPRILIVDDDRSSSRLLMALLGGDYEPAVAPSGEQALEMASSSPAPDLILLDILMPDMNGYEVCQELKKREKTRNIPVIFLTGKHGTRDEALGFELGAVDFIAKPVSLPILGARVATHLALARARRDLECQNERLEQRVNERTEALQKLTAEMSLAEERERRRLAGDLHDGPIQHLAAIGIKLGLAEAAPSAGQAAATIEEARGLLERSIRELRSLMVELSPPVLYELGFEAALEWLAEHMQNSHGIACTVQMDPEPAPLGHELRVMLFQAVRELLLNVVKHARADCAKVVLLRRGERLRIVVEDNGVGFDPHQVGMKASETGGFGLFSLRERLRLLGGSVTIESENGARVILNIPLLMNGGKEI